MSNCVPFQTQLASIMEVLAKAAVAEICELVDDSYAVLHLEISRKQKENETLKKKLHMMEMRTARRAIQKAQAVEGSADTRSDGAHVYSELILRGPSIEDHFPIVEGLFGKPSSLSLWRDGEIASVTEETSPLQSVVREESSGMEGEGPESLLIKEERLEEDMESSDSQRGLNAREERAVESDGGERAPMVDTHAAPEELTEQHRTKRRFLEDRRLDTVLKAEPEIETVNLQDTAGRPNCLGNEYVLYETPGELDTFFTQKTIGTVAGDAACSYTAKTNSESLSAHAELRLGPSTAKNADKNLSSLESLNEMDSLPFDVEAGMHSAWNKDMLSGPVYTQCRHDKKDWESEKLHPENVPDIFPPHTQMASRDNMAVSKSKAPATTRYAPCDESFATSVGMKSHRRVGTRERRFICTFCGKCFTSPQNLETHVRVHTGERPFCCVQCGKRFTQSGHLKTHQSVHTGERPYVCTHCGKRFAGRQNLRIHQQRNHQDESNVGLHTKD